MRQKIKIPSWIEPWLRSKPEALVFGLLPQLLMQLMSRYFRLKIEGLEHVPRRGAVIIAANHSGFAGLDAMLLSHEIRQATGRQPRVLTHFAWFLSKLTASPAQKMGFVEANMANGLSVLRKNQPVIIFPEGEHGNFKVSLKAYDLQEFKRGFVRMALTTGAPIVPVLIIGAEESQINLRQLNFGRRWRNLVLPLPLNFLPLPSKWRIKFLPPVRLPYPAASAQDNNLAREIAEDLREQMQKVLNEELKNRDSVYF
ncbi:MAG: lysophospholipid acyltransferase family protein [Bdellovibrionales bacterium]